MDGERRELRGTGKTVKGVKERGESRKKGEKSHGRDAKVPLVKQTRSTQPVEDKNIGSFQRKFHPKRERWLFSQSG